jgi:MFS family permease
MDSGMKNNIRKLYILNFFVSMQLFAGVTIPFFTIWGGISISQFLLLESFFSVCIFLFEVPTGAIADRFGRKKTISCSILFLIIGALVYSSTPNFYIFMLGEFFWAIGASLASGCDEALVYDTLRKIKKEKSSKSVFSKYESAGLMGLVLGAPLGSFIASVAGLQAPMILLTVPLSIALAISFTLKEPKFARKKIDYLKTMLDGTKYFFTHKTLKILAFDMISVSLVAYFLFLLNQKMLLNAGLGVEYLGFVFSAFVLAQIVVINNFSRLERLFGSKKRLIFFSSMIAGVMLIVGNMTSYLPLVLVSIVVAVAFGSSRSVLFSSYYNKFIPSNKRATVLSSISMTRRLTIAIANVLIGIFIDSYFTFALIALGIFAIVVSIISGVEEDMLKD